MKLLSNRHFPALKKSKRWVINYFPPYIPFPRRQYVAILSLLYHYFNGKFSDQLHFLARRNEVRPLQPRCALLHSQLWITFIPYVFHLYGWCSNQKAFLPELVLWKRVPCSFFTRHYNLNIFKYRDNRFLTSISSSYSFPNPPSISQALFSNPQHNE